MKEIHDREAHVALDPRLMEANMKVSASQ